MNYNANAGPRTGGLGRKIKRVSDVNAMGYNPYNAALNSNVQQNIYPNITADTTANFQQGYQTPSSYVDEPYAQLNVSRGPTSPVYGGQTPSSPQAPFQNVPSNLVGLGQPVMQDLAMQYGQQLAGAGKTIIKQEMEKYVPVTKLKYYFAVDTKYVVMKLMLLFFPFTQSNWSMKNEQEGAIQPRFEINAPDLYIPLMAYITYVLVAGLVLGTQNRFTPEQIGVTASSALAWWVVELAIYLCTLYIMQINTSLKTLDLLAYSGYKFVGTTVSILISVVTGKTGYYVTLSYVNLALAFFLVGNLKVTLLPSQGSKNEQHYYSPGNAAGHKRRLYFMFFVAVMQPLLSWWLSYHLVQTGEGSNNRVTV
ncbi:protein YIF1B [Cylas formicarius]|uniref:protein YIF1B n=1 Tax=Cylas formicarius TaxID=197179 RepID=UPI002958C54A|nr:protein YIF1B [Cylas formicarius]